MNVIDEAVATIMAARYSPQVGDRVRVLARPECEYCRVTGDEEVGLIGTVDSVEHTPNDIAISDPDEDRDYLDHHVWVSFDPPYDPEDISHFTVTELEPIGA